MMLRRGLAVAALVASADQLSKGWVLGLFAERQPIERVVPVTGFFNLVLTWNRGMSFGLFNNDATLNALIFTVIAAAIVSGLVVWLRRAEEPLIAVAIGPVIGGPIGNVVHRLGRGAVGHFLDFHPGGWPWFGFNPRGAADWLGVRAIAIGTS